MIAKETGIWIVVKDLNVAMNLIDVWNATIETDRPMFGREISLRIEMKTVFLVFRQHLLSHRLYTLALQHPIEFPTTLTLNRLANRP